MRTLVLLAFVAGCTGVSVDDTGDTSDTDTADTSDTDDSGDTDTADTDTADTGDTADTDTDVPDPPTPREQSRRWKLVWRDEFNGPTLANDPCYDAVQTPPRCMDRYWSQTTCDPSTYANLAGLNKCTWVAYDIYNWMDWGKPLGGHGMNKLDASQIRVENGILHLTAKPVSPITWEPGDPWPWDCGNGGVDAPWYVSEDCPTIAGGIHSNPDFAPTGFSKQYGRFEVYAIIPNQMGSWPAHWLLPEGGGWPDDGEIDIMEAVSHDPSTVIGTFHSGKMDGLTHVHQGQGNLHDPGDPRFAEEWHLYAVEWEDDEIRFFVDDLEIGHIEDGLMLEGDVLESTASGVSKGDVWPAFPVEIPSLPFYFILNTTIVPTGGFSLKDFAPVDHQIDWVRVYEPCAADDTDPACIQRSTGSSDVTTRAWMSGDKWSPAYRVQHTGDFDGDGDDDLLLRTRSAGHATYLLRGDPSGEFLHEETLTTVNGMSESAWSDAYRAGLVGDFDGDGADDLLLQGRGSGDDTFLLLANGAGGFDAPITLTSSAGQDGAKWAAADHDGVVGDFDGNGKDDVLLVPRTSVQQARLLLSNGTGGFQNAQVLTTSFGLDGTTWNSHDHEPTALDLDGDGYDDVLLRGKTTQRHTRLVRGASGGFQAAVDLTYVSDLDEELWSDASHALVHTDLDADGDADLILQGRATDDDTWIVRGGTGGIESANSVVGALQIFAQDWAVSRRVATTGDVNGDGYGDILLRSADDSRRTTVILGGPNQFAIARDITEVETLGPVQWSDEAREATLLDIDGDGRDDVFLRGRTSDDKSFVVYLPTP